MKKIANTFNDIKIKNFYTTIVLSTETVPILFLTKDYPSYIINSYKNITVKEIWQMIIQGKYMENCSSH